MTSGYVTLIIRKKGWLSVIFTAAYETYYPGMS